MINKKIAMSAISIVSALAMMGGSAFAAFSAQATATGSTFSTGTDSLLVSPDNVTEHFNTTITSPFTDTKVSPGYHKVFTFFLKNDNAKSTDDLNVSATFTGGLANAALDGVLTTQFDCTDGTTLTTASPFSVTSMRGGSVSLGKIVSGDVATCHLTVTLPSSADNSVSNQSTSFDVNFNADQVTPTP